MKRITIEVQLNELEFASAQRAAQALATLQELADARLLHMETAEVRGYGARRKRRADAKPATARTIRPQMAAVREALLTLGVVTPQQVAAATGMNENSVRAQLNGLLALGLAEQRGGRPKTWAATPTPFPAPIGGLQ